MDRMKMHVDELRVESFEVEKPRDDRMEQRFVRTVDPTRCEPHSCMPTFPC